MRLNRKINPSINHPSYRCMHTLTYARMYTHTYIYTPIHMYIHTYTIRSPIKCVYFHHSFPSDSPPIPLSMCTLKVASSGLKASTCKENRIQVWGRQAHGLVARYQGKEACWAPVYTLRHKVCVQRE